MTQRRTLKIKTLSVCKGYESWTPDEFLMKIAAAVAAIPEEYRTNNAIVELEGYGEGSAELTIQYNRPENDEEYNERMAHEKALQEKRDRAAFEQYQMLKQRFEK